MSNEERPVLLPALIVKLAQAKLDSALSSAGPGGRRVAVTELRSQTEQPVGVLEWTAPAPGARCDVIAGVNYEVGTFTHRSRQDRHHHLSATEIYLVLDGTMHIEIEGTLHCLVAGDMVIVSPGAVHEVKPDSTEFLSRVISVNCLGPSDKFLDPR